MPRNVERAESFDFRQIQISHAYLPRHQLVQQRLEQLLQHGALPPVQIDLAVDGVQDVGGNGNSRLSIAAVFKLNFPSEAEIALPATMLVPSSEPKKDAVGHKAPAVQEFNQIAREQGLKAWVFSDRTWLRDSIPRSRLPMALLALGSVWCGIPL